MPISARSFCPRPISASVYGDEGEHNAQQSLLHVGSRPFAASVDSDGQGLDFRQRLLDLVGVLLVGAVLLAVERVGQLSVHFECFRCVLHLRPTKAATLDKRVIR